MNFKREGKRNILATTATAVLPGILLTPSAWSQSNDEEKMGLLEEVVVTATYRSVSVQDLPMAVTALTGEALDDLGATEIQDYYRTVPNFSVVDRGPGQRIYTLRGVSTGLVTQSPATVGVYVDNVPISAGGLQPDLKIFDLERIEVLRGPQGTLYGS
ncbi:MAG: Plug domain-containing protein, partial [Pseudomonadota bacterium]